MQGREYAGTLQSYGESIQMSTRLFVCTYTYICFPSGCLLSNDTLVATNAQHLDLHFYHPLAEARTLEIRGQIWAGTGKADEEAVRAEQ